MCNQNPTGAQPSLYPLSNQEDQTRTLEETLQVFLQNELTWLVRRHNLVHYSINARLSEVECFSMIDCQRMVRIFSSGCGACIFWWGNLQASYSAWAAMLADSGLKAILLSLIHI